MRLILTRHGETIENRDGILQGHLPGKLSKTGIQQAKKLAFKLKDEKIDSIYSSDLARAVDTTKEIAKYHPNIPINFVVELRELDLGGLTGKSINDIDYTALPKDIETRESMRKRLKEFLFRIYSENSDKSVLFVGHNGTNLALISIILDKHIDFINELEPQHNTAINVFEIRENNNNVVHLMNCIKHLELPEYS
ncbi:MAG: histidine phosphatase family protein [bacterium]